MASAAITIIEQPATIESDVNEAVITKEMANLRGVLGNASLVDVWLKVSVTDTAASGVATSNAQAQLMYPLVAGSQFKWLRNYTSVAHKTAGAAAVLSWAPIGDEQ